MEPNQRTEQAMAVAEAEARENALLAEMAASPVVVVTGVVEPSGVTGWMHADGTWTLHFSFHSWRIGAAGIRNEKLMVRRRVLHDAFPKVRQIVVPYSVVRIRARVVVESSFGTPQALVEEVIGPDTSDRELNHQSEMLERTVTFEDSQFGTFTLDRRVNWYTAETLWISESVSLNLLASESDALQNALETARSLWRESDSWNRQIHDFARQSLLSINNDFWLDEDEPPLTADEFDSRITLESITVTPTGSFDFWYGDDDMFAGHAIEVRGTLSDGLFQADIAG